jgi:hypothetical protein
MSPNGAPFAKVFGVERATVMIADSISATLETPTLVLVGFIDSQRLHVHAKRPFVVADFLVPGPAVPMRYLGARDNRLTLELTVHGVTTKQPLRPERTCDDLRIDVGGFDLQAPFGFEILVRTSLQADIAIPLSVEADGPPIAELRYESSPRAEVIAWKGSHARVIVHDDSLDPARNVLVFGWIPKSALLEAAEGTGGSWARGGDRAPMSRPPSKRPRLVCDRDVDLHVQLDRDVRIVGSIKPHTVIELADDNDPVEVTFPRAHAELVEGARWLVERAALAGCITPP